MYVVLEAQYQSSVSAAVRDINAKSGDIAIDVREGESKGGRTGARPKGRPFQSAAVGRDSSI